MSTFGQDILTAAVEGGINYWATVCNANRFDGAWTIVTLRPADDPEEFVPVTVRATQMERAARELAQGHMAWSEELKRALRDRDAGRMDAGVCDAIVQQAAFGEVVYG